MNQINIITAEEREWNLLEWNENKLKFSFLPLLNQFSLFLSIPALQNELDEEKLIVAGLAALVESMNEPIKRN